MNIIFSYIFILPGTKNWVDWYILMNRLTEEQICCIH